MPFAFLGVPKIKKFFVTPGPRHGGGMLRRHAAGWTSVSRCGIDSRTAGPSVGQAGTGIATDDGAALA